MVFSYLGTKDEPIEDPTPGPGTVGEFIELPKEEGDHDHGNSGGGPPGDVGVYSTRVTFDRAGFWKVEIAASSPEGPATAEASFEVLEKNRVPAPGDMAPLVENLTSIPPTPRRGRSTPGPRASTSSPIRSCTARRLRQRSRRAVRSCW